MSCSPVSQHKERCSASSLDGTTPASKREMSIIPLHMAGHSSPSLASSQSIQSMLEKNAGGPTPQDLLGRAGVGTAAASSWKERVRITHLESAQI